MTTLIYTLFIMASLFITVGCKFQEPMQATVLENQNGDFNQNDDKNPDKDSSGRPTQLSCKVENGIGFRPLLSDGYGDCLVESCNSGYHKDPEQESCAINTLSCEIANGSGQQTWNQETAMYDACTVDQCNMGFHKDPMAEACAPDTVACEIPNGTGQSAWNAETAMYDACKVDQCNEGHHKDPMAEACAPNVISCAITNGNGQQTWDGANYSACVVKACNTGYIIEGNACVPDVPKVCQPGQTKSCASTANGISEMTCLSDGSGYGVCEFKRCNTGFIEFDKKCYKDLAGSFASQCRQNSEIPGNNSILYNEFQADGELRVTVRNFLNPDDRNACRVPYYDRVVFQKKQIVGPSEAETGALEVNYTPYKMMITPTSNYAVEAFNAAKFCGLSDWQKGVAKEFTNQDEAWSQCGWSEIHTLNRVDQDGDLLLVGDFMGETDLTKRPDTLNRSQPLYVYETCSTDGDNGSGLRRKINGRFESCKIHSCKDGYVDKGLDRCVDSISFHDPQFPGYLFSSEVPAFVPIAAFEGFSETPKHFCEFATGKSSSSVEIRTDRMRADYFAGYCEPGNPQCSANSAGWALFNPDNQGFRDEFVERIECRK